MLRVVDIEAHLIDRARLGDRGAFEALLKGNERRAFRVAFAMLRNEADARDVCQESFVRAYRSLTTFSGEARFATWLHRIVVNSCIDRLRRSRLAPMSEYEDGCSADVDGDETGLAPVRLGFDPAKALEHTEIRGRIAAALASLSPIHRAVFVLREIEGLSYAQIADRLGCAIGTVMSRLFHARRHLQRALADYAADR